MINRLFASCAGLALAFSPIASATAQDAPVLASTGASPTSGPALWRVADDDTTIYLFGTVHILPGNIDWYGGTIAAALETADLLVTEIPADAMSDQAVQASIMRKAMLPEGQSLRGMLTKEERAAYEASLYDLGLPPEAFDRFRPWFAGLTVAVLPLVQAGYDPEMGVEEVLEALAPASVQRGALETGDQQIDFLNKLPRKSQIAMLMSSARDIPRMIAQMDEMVNMWVVGDADGLAQLIAQDFSDPVVAKTLLHDRNETWAAWIDERLDRPGTVFVAVGAGHLVGTKSVQDYLAQRGIETTRIQ